MIVDPGASQGLVMGQRGFPYYEFENYHLDLDRFAAIKARVAHSKPW